MKTLKYIFLPRYIEPFNKMIPLYHAFERGVVEKSVLAFAHKMEDQQAALEAGAKKAGGPDLIDDIAKVIILLWL